MSSTNKTTHYELSQYVAADKPTYLVDYNADMSAIDSAIYGADSLAQTNEASIGDLTLLDTTVKTDLVSAVNEVEGEVDTLSSTVAGHTTDIATNTSAIGTLGNLKTDVKTNLVSAVNEVKDEFQLFNLNTFKDYTNGQDISIQGGSIQASEVTVARNADGTIFKFYGQINATMSGSSPMVFTLTNTGINPTSAFVIKSAGYRVDNNLMYRNDLEIQANGDIKIIVSSSSGRLFFSPCLYFAKDFGDQPEQ